MITKPNRTIPSCANRLPAHTSPRKRTHLKPSQVTALQASFNLNPLPDATIRARLAIELGVTERTVQIWFQNRRAKARKLLSDPYASASSVIQPDPPRTTLQPRYQATFRTMMTPELFEELRQDTEQHGRRRPRSSSKPEPKPANLNLAPPRAMSEGTDRTANMDSQGISTPPHLVSLPVHALHIGSWSRFAQIVPDQSGWDLVCSGSPSDRQLIWQVQVDQQYFRIQIHFDYIQQLRLCQQVQMGTGDLVGQLEVKLDPSGLMFSMWRLGLDHDWVRCGDFSEDTQASHEDVHVLLGNHDAFKQTLLDLIALAPELASKMVVVNPSSLVSVTPQPPSLDFRDFTVSPTATPEPCAMPTLGLPKSSSNNLMLQDSFFYPFYDPVDNLNMQNWMSLHQHASATTTFMC
ncbi:hypothetical protein DFQ28_010580 [Apophysomyces sp. BC1034]|nr:hypothetical protein DFQ30_011455 [Apophysomyces sp. BC1015]KAG0183500.1 hypothetical protein DFQ29_002554 [Apophysomyces sp. BC1021]KAG0194496.1 hypothetical protein DFQ28_010580 [Apophysomyces sp. BC1034]